MSFFFAVLAVAFTAVIVRLSERISQASNRLDRHENDLKTLIGMVLKLEEAANASAADSEVRSGPRTSEAESTTIVTSGVKSAVTSVTPIPSRKEIVAVPPRQPAPVSQEEPESAARKDVAPKPIRSRPKEAPARGAFDDPRSLPPTPPKAVVSESVKRWRRIERAFAEHWTGILGAVALVAGIVFLGTYTGIRLAPRERTLMVTGAALLLGVASAYFNRIEKWMPFAAWLRSSAAAVFLFACFASSAIPAFQWIDPTGGWALAVLLTGIGVNLYSGSRVSGQEFASLHVVLSMVPLALMPQSATASVIATGVTLIGLGLSRQTRWDFHALITLSAFGIFQVAWYLRQPLSLGGMERVLGLSAVALVVLTVVLVRYRGLWAVEGSSRPRAFRALPFVVHLGSWTMLASAFGVYVRESTPRGFALLALAGFVFYLSRIARRRHIRWIYLTDTLVAQTLVFVGLISLHAFVFHWMVVPPLLLLQSCLFLRLAASDGETVLEEMGTRVVQGTAVGMALVALAVSNPASLMGSRNAVLLVASALVAGGLVLLRSRRDWNSHALFFLSASAILHADWYQGAIEWHGVDRITGALAAALIASVVAFIHYRRNSGPTSLEVSPFVLHLGNWTFLATALIAYAGEGPRTPLLLALGGVVFWLSRIWRRKSPGWIYRTDTLVAEALGFVSLVTLYPFVFHWLLIFPVALLLAGLFLKVASDDDDPVLMRVGIHVVHGAALGLVVSGLVALVTDPAIVNQNAVILLAGAFIAGAIHLYLASTHGEAFDSLARCGIRGSGSVGELSTIGLGAGLIGTVALFHLWGGDWMAVAALGLSAGSLIVSRWFGLRSPAIAALFILGPAFLLSWWDLIGNHPVPVVSQILYHVGPLALAGVLVIIIDVPEPVRRIARVSITYLLGVHLGIACCTLFEPASDLLPAVVWLSLSLIALEAANRAGNELTRPALHIAYGLIVAFAAGYALVVLMSEAYVGPVRARLLIEGYSLAVLLYWWNYRPGATLESQKLWRSVHPLFLELVLIFVGTVNLVESPVQFRPAVWAALALVAIDRRVGSLFDERFRFYSLVFFWLASLDLVIVTSNFALPSPAWYEDPGSTGALAMALQVVYLIVGSERLNLTNLAAPPMPGRLAVWARAVGRREPLWIYYPFFVAGAVFLYWQFNDTALLTLLWAGEAFAVFAVSLIIREGHFRHMAMGALVACLVRLMFIDMHEADLGLRGLVFVGVGLLMLGMNALYTKYRDRLA